MRSRTGRLTYRELDERANRLAHLLKDSGVGAETAVAVLMERSADMVVATLAVLKAGGVYVPIHPSYPAARSTPTVDGSMVYALGSDGDLACLDASTGKVQWHKSVRSDFSGKPGTWAYSESPLIDGGMLICTPGGADATVVALDKKSGVVIW